MPAAKPVVQAEAIRLRLEERRGNNEIARLLGVSPGTVSRWLKPHPLSAAEVKSRWHRGGPGKILKPPPKPSKFQEAVAGRTLSTQEKGKIAEAAVLFRLVLYGFTVYGSMFDGDKADWVVGLQGQAPLRLQVRWARTEKYGKPLISLRCGNGRAKDRPMGIGEFDFIVGYDLVSDTAFVWAWAEIKTRTRAITTCEAAAERWDKLRGCSSVA